MSEMHKLISKFIDLSNNFKTLNLEYNDKNKDKIQLMYKHTTDIKSLSEKCKEYGFNVDYINTIVEQYDIALKPLVNAFNNKYMDYYTYQDYATPLRMCSAQSAGSSFACVGRLASITYSQQTS